MSKDVEVGSPEYYLLQMIARLRTHGEYRVRWEWAIREAVTALNKNNTP